MCDPEFRSALADARLHPRSGHSGGRRAGAVRRCVLAPGRRRSAATSTATKPTGAPTIPGEEPGPRLRRAWDRRAWAEARPDKIVPTDGAELAERWREELHELGFTPPQPAHRGRAVGDADRAPQPRPGRRAGAHPAGRAAVGVERRGHPRRGRTDHRLRRHRRRRAGAARAGRGPHQPHRRRLRAAAGPRRRARARPRAHLPAGPRRRSGPRRPCSWHAPRTRCTRPGSARSWRSGARPGAASGGRGAGRDRASCW